MKCPKCKGSGEVKGNRSLNQNDLSHVWYQEISQALHEDTPDEVKAECKLRFGVPILRAEDEEFRKLYDQAIKNNLTYEQKLEAMHILPVTSRMNKTQMSQYLTDIQAAYADRVQLEFPEEWRQ